MNWDEKMSSYSFIIERRLDNHLTKILGEAKAYHPFVEEVYSTVKEFSLRRGKRIAASTTLITYKGYMGEVNDQILNVCVGMELFRHSILVHDDLVDEDELRRGGRTIHKIFEGERDVRFGKGLSVFIGDIIYALSVQSILNSGFKGEKLFKAISLLSEGYREINESQILDLFFEYKDPDVDEWYIMASRRAASLFKTTILTGAFLAGAPPRDLGLLREAALNIGYSFDIQDDIIDTFASLKQYGRKPGGDIIHGKKPLHIIYTLEMAKNEEIEELKNLVKESTLTTTKFKLIRGIIKRSGALGKAKEKSRRHAERAKELIAETSLSKEEKEFLTYLIDYVKESLEWYK